jgi:hypothetical protein
MTLQYRGGARVPGTLGTSPGGVGGRVPGPIGRTLWQKNSTLPEPAATKSSKPKALIVLGTGHDGIKKGVRLNSDKYFDKSARDSFAPYTKDHEVTLVHVDSAKEMRELIEGDTWNVVIYFGHGVENQMALAPKEGGKQLNEEELANALKKAQTKQVYLFGCKAGETGLARKLSKDVPGTTVHGTFGSLDVDWEQRMDPDKTFTNKFVFKEVLTEYKSGFQMKDGKKTKQRRQERGDRITIGDDPLEPMVDQ